MNRIAPREPVPPWTSESHLRVHPVEFQLQIGRGVGAANARILILVASLSSKDKEDHGGYSR